MPPPSIPTGLSRTPSLPTSSSVVAQLPKIFLLVLVIATCVRVIALHYTRRKSRILAPCSNIPEKAPALCQPSTHDLRRNSEVSYIHLLDHLRQDRGWESQDHQHQNVLRERRVQPTPGFQPIYPWISPPKPLPGPYDPRLYPLPTLRRHSSVDPSPGTSEETNAISYTRRVSTNSIPTQQATLHGTVTTSSQGWRRNQWVVSDG